METTITAREDRARRLARRQGYRLSKSRIRNPEMPDYGHWAISDPMTGMLLTPAGVNSEHGIALSDVEAWLTS